MEGRTQWEIERSGNTRIARNKERKEIKNERQTERKIERKWGIRKIERKEILRN